MNAAVVLILALLALAAIAVLLWRKRASKVAPDTGTPVTETIECKRCGTVRVTTGAIKGITHHIERRTYTLPADRESGEYLTCRTIGHKWPQIPELSVFGDERRHQ